MYVREENIEEENLDWGEHVNKPSIDKQDKAVEETKKKTLQAPVSKQKKMFLNHSTKIAKIGKKLNIKSELTDIIKQNSAIFLAFSILAVPYMVGFLLSYFLYFFYGGMPIGNFLTVQQEVELWFIGAYFFITASVIWLILTPNK